MLLAPPTSISRYALSSVSKLSRTHCYSETAVVSSPGSVRATLASIKGDQLVTTTVYHKTLDQCYNHIDQRDPIWLHFAEVTQAFQPHHRPLTKASWKVSSNILAPGRCRFEWSKFLLNWSWSGLKNFWRNLTLVWNCFGGDRELFEVDINWSEF